MVDPGGGSRVLVAATRGARVALDDAFGPNSKGFTPLDRLTLFLYTHITKQ